MPCRDQEKSCVERSTVIDVAICDRSRSRGRLTVAGVRRVDGSIATIRVQDVSQLQRLIFAQGLLTREPQIPRLIFLEQGMPESAEFFEALQRHWRTMWLPIIEIVSPADRFRTSCTHASVITSPDPERYIASVVRAATPFLSAQPHRSPIELHVQSLTSSPA